MTLQETIQKLGQNLEVLESRLKAALKENYELKTELLQAEEELKRLRQDNDYLIVSHKLASDPDEIVRCRKIFAGLIADIDKCISQLKE